jgi:hypothetical protein
MTNPGEDRFAGRLRDLKLNRPLGLLLHDDRARSDPITVGDITDAQLQEIAAAQLAVERQIEQRELALAIAQMSLSLSGAFCPTSFPLFQGSRRPDTTGDANILNSYCFKGSSKREIHPIGGIPTGRQISMCQFDSAGLTRA